MQRSILALLALPLLLSGCTDIVIPADAVVAIDDSVPAATLWAWAEPEGNFTRFVAHFEHNGSGLFTVHSIQPHGYWNLTIFDADGREVLYDNRASRKDFDEVLLAPHEETFYFTWLHNEFERYQRAGTYDAIPDHPVAAGDYTAVVGFNLREVPDGAFEARVPFTVA